MIEDRWEGFFGLDNSSVGYGDKGARNMGVVEAIDAIVHEECEAEGEPGFFSM